MFHTNPFNKDFHRGVTQAQLNDIYDYKKYLIEDKDIKGIKYATINKDNNPKDEQQRNPEVHLSNSSESEEQRVSK